MIDKNRLEPFVKPAPTKQYMIALTLMQNNKYAWTCHYIADTTMEHAVMIKAGINCVNKDQAFKQIRHAIDRFEGEGGLVV